MIHREIKFSNSQILQNESRLKIYPSALEQEGNRRKRYISLDPTENLRQLCYLIELSGLLGSNLLSKPNKRLKINGVFIK